jgi:glycosyltransferase involved in cell wall biosynthesis
MIFFDSRLKICMTLEPITIAGEKPISLSIFFPTYNEEANIERSVQKAKQTVERITDIYEIIIVDDGSSDRTPDIADHLACTDDHIRVVRHPSNKGYGAAVYSGIHAARYDYIFFTDADLQFDLSELAILVHFVPEYSVVLGYRSPRRDPFLRRLNARGWNVLNRMLFGLNVKDIDCAFKLMDRKLVASLPLRTRGAMMSAELLIRLQRRGVVCKEIPVTHFPRLKGVATGAKFSVIARALKELIYLYRGTLGYVSRKQLFRFAIIGVINTSIDIGVYVALTRYTALFSDHLLFAKAFSFGCGTIFSFFMNRTWTFGTHGALKVQELIRFYLAIGVGAAINILSLSFFITALRINDLVGVAFATVITFIWNYAASKLWVYKEVPVYNHRS